MEQNLTYKMDENGLVEDIINEDGQSVMGTFDEIEVEEKEEDSNVNVMAIGAGIVAVAGLAILARKPIKKVFKATMAGVRTFKAEMKKSDDDDENEQLIEGLLDVVPTVPITKEKLDVFLTTLKSIIPQIDITLSHDMDVKEDNIEKDFYSEKINAENVDEIIEEEETSKKVTVSLDKMHITEQCAIILTKRPAATAGVLHELTQIAEKPSGVYRETVLNIINEEYTQSKPVDSQQKTLADFFPVTPLSLSDAQLNVIKNVENNKLVSVFGPPGTGKSQTIVNLVAHLIANGKTVLVASRMDKAVDVVAERLNSLGAPFLALRAGRLNYQKELSLQLQDLLSNKVDLGESAENIVVCDNSDMEKLLKSISTLNSYLDEVKLPYTILQKRTNSKRYWVIENNIDK